MCDPLFSSCKEIKMNADFLSRVAPSEKNREVLRKEKEKRKEDQFALGFAGSSSSIHQRNQGLHSIVINGLRYGDLSIA